MNEAGLLVGADSGQAFLIAPRDDDPADDDPDTWFIDDGHGNNLLMKSLGVMNGQLPGAESRALGINDHGHVVGFSNFGPRDDRAFLIVPVVVDGALEWFLDDGNGGNALMIDLTGTAHDAGTNVGIACAVNDSGHVVGYYWSFDQAGNIDVSTMFIVVPEDANADGIPDTWFRDDDMDGVNDLMVFLEREEGAPGGIARFVNADGWVVGDLWYGSSTVGWFAVIPEDTDGDGVPDSWFEDDELDGINDLMFELPYPPDDLNDLGQVTMNNGVWQLDPVLGATLLYDLEEIPKSLGEGGGGALNDRAGVVGSAFKHQGSRWSFREVATPLYWTDGGLNNLFDLMVNDEGIEGAEAVGINDFGHIYGYTRIDELLGVAFIAVPIPSAP
jgi:hypothetical protein